MQRRRHWRILAITLVVAVAASAAAAASAGAKTHAASSRGIDTAKKTIKIATVSYVGVYADVAKGVKARFDQANQKKELPGGYTIDYIGMIDDKSTADGEVAAIRQATEQDRVFALVGGIMPYLAADYPNQQKLPIVSYSVNDSGCSHHSKTPWYLFGFTGCLNPLDPEYASPSWPGAVDAQLGGGKGKTAACISEDNDGGKQGVRTVCEFNATAFGFKIVYQKATVPPAPSVVSDWAPYVQDIMTANNGKPPDVLFNLPGIASVIGLSAALKQAGFQGMNTNPVAGTQPQLTALAAGWTSFTQWATPEAATQLNNQDMANIVTQLKNAGVDNIGFAALLGYFSADMFVAITKKAGKNLTPEKWQKTASTFTYAIKDIVGPTAYPRAWSVGTPCSQLAESDSTKWTITTKYNCYPVVDLKKNKLIPYDKVKA
jgi:hypothetical protein